MAKKKVKDQGEELKLDLSPMIDMVFLLLIFFIVVSIQSEVDTDPEVQPTIASESVPQTDSIARIVINAYEKGGQIVYTDEDLIVISEAELQGSIKKQVKEIQVTRPNADITLHMRCDRDLEWKFIQKVKTAAAAESVVKVNFASFQTGKDLPNQ